jgi:hypothetical protein
MNKAKMVLVTRVAHVGENIGTKTNLRFIVSTSLNITISVLRNVTACRYTEIQDRVGTNCCLHYGLTSWSLKIHPKIPSFHETTLSDMDFWGKNIEVELQDTGIVLAGFLH